MRVSAKEIGVRLLLVVASLLVGLLALELLARLVLPPQQTVQLAERPVANRNMPEIRIEQNRAHELTVLYGGPRGARLRPNTHALIRNHQLSGRDIVIEVNALGLRYEPIGRKEPGELRVLVLGDSIVFGDFVQADETLPGRLEALTNPPGATKRIRFLNAGVAGLSTIEELYYYQEIGPLVEADVVLLAMYLNDAQQAGAYTARSMPKLLAKSRFLSWGANRLEVVRKGIFRDEFGKHERSWRETFRADRDFARARTPKDKFDREIYNADLDFGLAWAPGTWDVLGSLLVTFDSAVKANGARLAVTLLPLSMQIVNNDDYEDRLPQTRCRAICEGLRIPFYDPIDDLRADYRQNEKRQLYDHCHYRPYGYEILASGTLGWLRREGLVPR